jgi:predicted DsbA family dithiol-disulfide isomerase
MDPITFEGVDPITDNPWIPTRGGTQGDPLSTLGWVVFGILLTALNEVQREFPFYVRHHGSRLEPQLLACYADDLHSVFSSREATVKSNCTISAFAAMFGIEFAPAKLRAITTISPPGEVVLYSRERVPIVVPSIMRRTLLPWASRII